MLIKYFFIASLLLSPLLLQSADINQSNNQILFLMRTGHAVKAIDLYKEKRLQTGKHDYEMIQEMGLLLLDEGYRSSELETRILTSFGAGISLNERALYILEAGIDGNAPELQIISLNFLSQYQNDVADAALQRAMIAQHPLIRLEAAFILAQKKAPRAYSYAESLMYRFDDELAPLFPQFFAMIGSPESTRMLRKLMTHRDQDVRVASILAAARFERDDLLGKIRTLSTHGEKAQQEAAAFALGVLKDESSIPRLKILAQSSVPHVRLAAMNALYSLGNKHYKSSIEAMAKEGDVFAISVLSDIDNTENLLFSLTQDRNPQVRINAAYSLLKKQDPRCLNTLLDILFLDSRGLILAKTVSLGKSLTALKVIPSGMQNFPDDGAALEISLNLREEILESTLDLEETYFLQLAKAIFLKQQNDLVPLTTELLEQLRSKEAIALLKEHQQQPGAPLTRNYCNLALYRLNEEGPFAEQIRLWIKKSHDNELIRFRPLLPRELSDQESPHKLTPQDSSKLLITSFETFVTKKDEAGIDLLLEAIQKGNQKNKYALAGLLMRAVN